MQNPCKILKFTLNVSLLEKLYLNKILTYVQYFKKFSSIRRRLVYAISKKIISKYFVIYILDLPWA